MLRSIFLIGTGLAFLTFGGQELIHHAQAIRQMKEVTTPLVAEIPQLEQRVEILKQQAELSKYQAALRTGSQEEFVEVYLLPKKTNLETVLQVFEGLGAQLESDQTLQTMSSISFGSLEDRGNYAVQPLSVTMSLKEQGLKDILLFIRLAGIRTIGDLLSNNERSQLIARSEEESPASVVVLADYFSTDLLKYMREEGVRRLAEEKVRQSFSSEGFLQAFNEIIQSNLFTDTERILTGPLGDLLQQQTLWPMQFMTLDNLVLSHEQTTDWYQAELSVLLYTQ